MTLRTLRLSERAKEQLIRLKRLTGLKNWNVLCRWALCTSMADSAPVSTQPVVTDSNVEMSWAVLTGDFSEFYEQLLFERCASDGVEASSDGMHDLLVRHVHRGIGMLSADVSQDGVADLLTKALEKWDATASLEVT
ncbi:MAG: DNA sulfur modification protein DndE [Dyella sp.]|uniref:DNA sulfur modification protein DndE n=1 Tax=Dyella sp. TaxID=1869338 RepID=UPI003F81C3FD